MDINDRLTIKRKPGNWIVYERKIVKEGKNAGSVHLAHPSYFGKIEHMAAYLVGELPDTPEGDTLAEQINSLTEAINKNTAAIIAAVDDGPK